VKRAAPAGGYDYKNKEWYRKAVWHWIRRQRKLTQARSVMFMPSIEGVEIELAYRYGFAASDLHVVDHNPAIVAHLKRRHPDIHTYGVDVFRALPRAVRTGASLVAVSLDMTCGCTMAFQKNLREMAPLLMPGTVLAVNLLRGREQNGVLPEIARKGLPETFEWRDVMIQSSLVGGGKWADLLDQGVYKSTAGNQTFRWGVWQIEEFHEPGTRLSGIAMRLNGDVEKDSVMTTEMRRLKRRLRTLGCTEDLEV